MVLKKCFIDGFVTLVDSGITGTSRHLLEQNTQALSKITANLSTFKVIAPFSQLLD